MDQYELLQSCADLRNQFMRYACAVEEDGFTPSPFWSSLYHPLRGQYSVQRTYHSKDPRCPLLDIHEMLNTRTFYLLFAQTRPIYTPPSIRSQSAQGKEWCGWR